MRFVVASVTYTNMPTCLKIDNGPDYNAVLRDVCNIASGTGGLEFYFVDELAGKNVLACNVPGQTASILGIVVATNATPTTLGHEVGHSCGLQDVYVSDSATTNAVTGYISKARLPDDWGTQSDKGYYSPSLSQSMLLQRLLMYGRGITTKYDLSYGDVYGLYYIWTPAGKVWFLNAATVGFAEHANRQPIHQ